MRKRFLSLLLALTMVLSLTVVPARANETVVKGDDVVLTVTYKKGVACQVEDDSSTTSNVKGKANYYTVEDNPTTTLAVSDFTVQLKSGYEFDKSTDATNYPDGKKLESSILKLKVKSTATTSGGQTNDAFDVGIALTEKKISAPTVTVGYESTPGSNKAYEGQTITFTATKNSNSQTEDYPTGVSYVWSYAVKNSTGGNRARTWTTTANTTTLTAPTANSYQIFCKVSLPGNAGTTADSEGVEFETVTDPYKPAYNESDSTSTKTLVAGQEWQIPAPYLKGDSSNKINTSLSISWRSSNNTVAKITTSGNICTVKPGTKSGDATIYASITYQGKTYPELAYKVTVKALDIELGSITNGDYESYDDGYFAKLLADKINDVLKNSFTASSITSVSLTDKSSRLTFTKDEYDGANVTDLYAQDFRINAAAGCIGEQTFQVTVNGGAGSSGYVVTLTVPVTSDGTVKETVTGTTASSSVSFDVDDVTGGDYLYIYGTKSGSTLTPSSLSSTSTGYDGYWTKTDKGSGNWALFDEDDTVTIPASKFSSGKVTLYVVSLDSYGVATTGTIEVSQKDYSIKYNVVAGESVSFEQDDFEDFLEEYADDNISTSKGDYFEFDYVKFSSLPTSANGVLYEGSDKVKTSDEISDLDEVSFDSGTKAKDSITIPFTLYAKRYDKNDKVVDKKVTMSGSVVISVVKEDIVYTVGVNSSVKFDDDDFQDYLNDYSSSYRKSTLSYVTFEVGRNSAISAYFSGTGALYRYYSAYGTSSAVSESDEFYYEPKSSSKNYDLADVTYVTTRFAKAGDTVYIPFTAYGTKSEKVTGTVAIKIKQTMNFTDVHTYDYFYDSVQWAVNNNVTAGTSATTFSPSQSCTRAQIVTFLWRAAGSPEPRSTSNPFTDVSATRDADYYKAILWAVENKITTGTSATTFSPSGTCTRAQIVTFLYRYKGSPSVSGSLSFTDVSKTTHSAYYNAILWAVRNSVTTGNGNNTFAPSATCNRGEAVTFLYRALA